MTSPNILSVNTAIFDGYSLDKAFETIAELGATHVEPSFTVGYTEGFTEGTFCEQVAQDYRKRITAAGLACHSVAMHMDLGDATSVEAFTRRMEFAAGFGAKIVISNTTTVAKSDVFFRNMEQLVRRAELLNLYIGLENPGNGTNAFIASGQGAARICARIGSERVGINFDVGNVLTYHSGRKRPEKELSDCIDHVINIHAKDIKDTGNGYTFVPIGAGDVDWNATFKVIRTSDKDLGIVIEVPLRLRREAYSDPVRAPQRESIETIQQALIQSISFLKGCMPNKCFVR